MSPPCCKPFRIVELACLIFGFTFLFFLRRYNPSYDKTIHNGSLIYLFTAYGSLLCLLTVDCLAQMLKNPIANAPMCEVLTLGCIFCFISGTVTLAERFNYANSNAYTTLSALVILTCISFLTMIIFILDLIIMIRYA